MAIRDRAGPRQGGFAGGKEFDHIYRYRRIRLRQIDDLATVRCPTREPSLVSPFRRYDASLMAPPCASSNAPADVSTSIPPGRGPEKSRAARNTPSSELLPGRPYDDLVDGHTAREPQGEQDQASDIRRLKRRRPLQHRLDKRAAVRQRRKLSTFLRQVVHGFIGSGCPPRVC